jgi:hypothetical protein
MTLVLVRLLSLVALMALLWAPGALLRRRVLRAELGTPALDGLAEWVLGVAVWVTALFAVAAARALTPGVAWGLVAAAVMCGILARPSLPRPTPLGLALGALALALVLPLSVTAMTGDVSWDAGVYHLAVPKLWLDAGGFRTVPMLAYASWPLAGELLFALAMLLDDYVLAKLIQGGFALLLFQAMRAALPGRGLAVAGAAWLLVMANPVLLTELPLAYVDLLQAWALTAGLAFVGLALRDPERRSHALLLAGVAGGLAAAMKLNGFVGAGILGAAAVAGLALQARTAGQSWPHYALAPVARWAAPATLILWLPWPIKSVLETGNPLYPVAHSVFGGPDWSAELNAQLMAWQQGVGMGRDPLDWLLLPVRIVLEGGDGYSHFDGALSLAWLVAVPLAVWAAVRGDRTARLGLATGAVFFLAWALTAQQLRLLVPGLPLFAVAAGAGLGRLGPRAGWAALVLVAVAAAAADTGRFSRASNVAASLDLATRDADVAAAAPPIMGFVNRTLPPDAVIAMLNLNHRFFCDREVLADSFFEASQLSALLAGADTGAEVHRRLRGRGVTHVIWAQRDWGIDWPAGLPLMATDPTLVQVLHPGPSIVTLRLLSP